MYGNNFRPFMMPGNIPYTPYNGMTNTPISKSLFNTRGMQNIFRGLHNTNWSGMLNNVSRTLGVVREAIPVVKEVRPMINNMRSMIKIASVFKDETDTKKASTNNNIKKEASTNTTTSNNDIKSNYTDEPNFFL